MADHSRDTSLKGVDLKSHVSSAQAGDGATSEDELSVAPLGVGTIATPFDEIQRLELPVILDFLRAFWQHHAASDARGPVAPREPDSTLRNVACEHLPSTPLPLPELLSTVRDLLEAHIVKTAHPMFMGHVTPPALDVAALGDALAAVVNQNVAFATLSPIGTALESAVVRWLGEIAGYPSDCGGVLTSGGSDANLYGLAVARRKLLGPTAVSDGNYAEPNQRLRIYCSAQTHRSVDKAAMLLGLGTSSVVRVEVDSEHRILIPALRSAIDGDRRNREWRPLAIVGNAGTLRCCAVDDLRALRTLADDRGLWLHVDAAYGGFLRLASPRPHGLDALGCADSIVIDPHKLLFVPFDCGALLVRDPRHLSACFAAEGEYLQPTNPEGLGDFANLGMQLGRSMKALKVWLTIKRFGSVAFSNEYTRLLGLARHLRDRILNDPRFELLGPVPGTALCFRWRGGSESRELHLNSLNSQIRRQIVLRGVAFIDDVELSGKRGFRVCMTNFRTTARELDTLLKAIESVATGTEVGA